MKWQVGYPNKFRYLDDEHEAIAARLQGLREATVNDGNAQRLAIDIARMLREHIHKENRLMQSLDYPDRELHESYYGVLIDTLDYVLQFFDRKSMDGYGATIAQHIENKLAEEVFVDGLLAEYLRTAEA